MLYRFSYILVVICSFLASGCQSPHITEAGDKESKEVTFEPRFRVAGDARADGSAIESITEATLINASVYFLEGIEPTEDEVVPYNQPIDLNRATKLVARYDFQFTQNGATTTADTYGDKLEVGKTYYVLAIANAPFSKMPKTLKELKEGTSEDFMFKGSDLGATGDAANNDYFLMSSANLIRVEFPDSSASQSTPQAIPITLQRACAKVAIKATDLSKTYTIANNDDEVDITFPPHFFISDGGSHEARKKDDDGRADTIKILEARLVNLYLKETYWFARTLVGPSGISQFFPDVSQINTPATNRTNSPSYFSDPYTFNQSWKLEEGNSQFRPEDYSRLYKLFDTPIFRYDSSTSTYAVYKYGPEADPAYVVISENNAVPSDGYIRMGYVGENNTSYEWDNYWFKHAAPAILIKAKYIPGLLKEEFDQNPNTTFYGYQGRYFSYKPTNQDITVDFHENQIETYEGGVCYYLAWILTEYEKEPGVPLLAHIGVNEVGSLRNNFYRISLGPINYVGTHIPSSQIPRYNTFPINIIDWWDGGTHEITFE